LIAQVLQKNLIEPQFPDIYYATVTDFFCISDIWKWECVLLLS